MTTDVRIYMWEVRIYMWEGYARHTAEQAIVHRIRVRAHDEARLEAGSSKVRSFTHLNLGR